MEVSNGAYLSFILLFSSHPPKVRKDRPLVKSSTDPDLYVRIKCDLLKPAQELQDWQMPVWTVVYGIYCRIRNSEPRMRDTLPGTVSYCTDEELIKVICKRAILINFVARLN